METVKAAFIHSAELERYEYPAGCPFRAERAAMARRILLSMGLLAGPGRFEHAPVPATEQELETFHSARYLDVLRRAAAGQLDATGLFMGLGTEDTPIWRGMYEYARLACGATLAGARLILQGRAGLAFNPSGGYHHARCERAAGFCYINDVVVACMEMARAGRRVLFLDLDVHHGDGVQDAFYERSDVMTISVHETGKTLFPGGGFADEIGAGEGRGYNVNIALPAGTYDEPYLRVIRELVLPLIGAYGPDVIVFEIGMDGLSGDPLAHLSLTNNAHAAVAALVRDVGAPVLAVGGGGYNPANAARGWALCWSVLCGADEGAEAALALGGVMLGSTDWQGGLRDRALVPSREQVATVGPAVEETIRAIRTNVFPLHGL